MKKKVFDYISIILISSLFITLIVFVLNKDIKQAELFDITYKIDNEDYMILSHYDSDENIYYFFLPSSCNEGNCVLNLKKDVKLKLDESEVSSNTTINNITFNEKYVSFQGKRTGEVIRIFF